MNTNTLAAVMHHTRKEVAACCEYSYNSTVTRMRDFNFLRISQIMNLMRGNLNTCERMEPSDIICCLVLISGNNFCEALKHRLFSSNNLTTRTEGKKNVSILFSLSL